MKGSNINFNRRILDVIYKEMGVQEVGNIIIKKK